MNVSFGAAYTVKLPQDADAFKTAIRLKKKNPNTEAYILDKTLDKRNKVMLVVTDRHKKDLELITKQLINTLAPLKDVEMRQAAIEAYSKNAVHIDLSDGEILLTELLA